MAFVVDGSEWVFDGWSSDKLRNAIEDLLDRVDRAASNSEVIWIGDDLQCKEVYGTQDLWSLQDTASEIQLPPEIWQELAAVLGKASRYLDEPEWPSGFDDYAISIDHDPMSENPDVAWAHHNVRTGKAVACLGLQRKGPFETSSNKGNVNLHWIGDNSSQSKFWRDAIDIERDSPQTLERLAPKAFPDLYFSDRVWEGLDLLIGGYHANSKQLRLYLERLNDDGGWAFTAPPPAQIRSEVQGTGNASPTSQLVGQRFTRLGLDVTPENPDVFQNTKCREAREIQVDGKTLYCEWHGKLQAHQNRIHIHAPTVESGQKLIIAIFADHLPLPN